MIRTNIYWMVMLSVLIIQQGQGQSILPDDYAYDWNGSLVRDLNKDIADIHYNVLNLPDTITYTDGRKIVYVYTATGQKVCQQVLDAAGATTVRRDYTGSLLYENGTLQHLLHEQGRVLWREGNPEYQYHLTDHLGNVRTTLTSAPETREYQATMEGEKAEEEEQHFSDMHVRSLYTAANHTAGGNEVLNVRPGVARAASLGLAVNKGDVVYLEVYSYYENGVISDDDPQSPSLAGAVTTIASSVSAIGGKLLSGEAGALPSAAAPAAMLLPGADAGTEQVPSAYLNYALFDKHYVMVTGGYRKVTKQGAYTKELLTLGPLEIKQSGYLDVYLSNAGAKYPVYFDDLKVTHVEGPIVQEDSYDPLGMSLSAQHAARFGELENRYLYNGKEQQTDHDLNWYDYGARMYDAALGRWHAIDPMSEKYAAWSPYQYVLNNPIKFVDPDGKDVAVVRIDARGRVQPVRSGLAMKLARSIPEGKRIIEEAENNENVKVYIAFLDRMLQSENVSYGVTKREFEAGTLSYPKDKVSSVFNGLDISKDINEGKDVYLVSIALYDDEYKENIDLIRVAKTILHELEAHVNIPQQLEAIITMMGRALPGPYANIHHILYGDFVDSEGREKISPGSSADRVRKQLSEKEKFKSVLEKLLMVDEKKED